MSCKPSLATRLLLHGIVLLVVLVMATTARAYDAADTIAAIEQASETTGVGYWWLHRVVSCETGGTMHPGLIGDHGTSFGAAQLHQGGGELPRFYAFGFDDPFDPYQAITFMANEFSLGRATAWSCR